MRVVKARHNRAAGQLDAPRARAGQLLDRRVIAKRQDAISGDRQGGRVGAGRVHGMDHPASEYSVGPDHVTGHR